VESRGPVGHTTVDGLSSDADHPEFPFVGGLNNKAGIRAPLAPNWLPFLPLASIPYDPCQPALVRRPRNLQTTEEQLFIRSLSTRS
jgi:hypothetical protein